MATNFVSACDILTNVINCKGKLEIYLYRKTGIIRHTGFLIRLIIRNPDGTERNEWFSIDYGKSKFFDEPECKVKSLCVGNEVYLLSLEKPDGNWSVLKIFETDTTVESGIDDARLIIEACSNAPKGLKDSTDYDVLCNNCRTHCAQALIKAKNNITKYANDIDKRAEAFINGTLLGDTLLLVVGASAVIVGSILLYKGVEAIYKWLTKKDKSK